MGGEGNEAVVCDNLLFGDHQGLPALSVYGDVETLLGSSKSRPVSGQTGGLLLLGRVLHESSDWLGLVLLPRCCTSCPRTHSGALISSGARGTLLSCLQPPSTGASASTPSWAAAPMA